jgi:hypothetical protein
MSDVCFDVMEMVNQTLELVDKAYPGFGTRFDKQSADAVPPSET